MSDVQLEGVGFYHRPVVAHNEKERFERKCSGILTRQGRPKLERDVQRYIERQAVVAAGSKDTLLVFEDDVDRVKQRFLRIMKNTE